MKNKHQQQIDGMKEELFIRAMEYARMKSMGASLEDGFWVVHNKVDAEQMADFKLHELGICAVKIAREMTIVPNERNSFTRSELDELRQSIFGTMRRVWRGCKAKIFKISV